MYAAPRVAVKLVYEHSRISLLTDTCDADCYEVYHLK